MCYVSISIAKTTFAVIYADGKRRIGGEKKKKQKDDLVWEEKASKKVCQKERT